ncbi:MAG: hypothetical protein N5P05_002911 [Chroococcopsis gigantea SAG 12.99]|jgi:8-oxo-dGTP diphosphatase|nr:NUDIX domain-containing protein [Chlorogloea purpurea SAG 13.99]MDV3001305.1 hypothetical protein [Chroococcopsis gigantea SAG 12.99]
MTPRLVAMAILSRDGKYLMQLRDNLPHILYPGHWGLFGGHLERGETPEEGLIREVMEEINYPVKALRKFRCYNDEEAMRHIFHVPLTVDIDTLQQEEGFDLALLAPDSIESGQYYSLKAREIRPLGKIHQRILLDFIEVDL